ncbi:MAG: nucleotidyltransferase domain-containing protein [Candidatus Methanomethyliaceae archaeon]
MEESVKQLREVLSSLPEVEQITLLSSYAQGRRDLLTDLDVLVVMHTNLPFLERQRFLYQRLALPVDADILCYTSEEFEALKDGPFWTNALKQVVVLYEKKST